MGRVDLNTDLDMVVARGPVRAWMEEAMIALGEEVVRSCPPGRMWVTRNDNKVRATHAEIEGQTIPANLRFIMHRPNAGPTVKGQSERTAHHAEGRHGGRTGNIARKPEEIGFEQGRYPRDEQLSPGNRYNCRCQALTIDGIIAASMEIDPLDIAGTVIRGTIGSRFPRIAESEFGNGQDQGLHFMAGALEQFAAKVDAADTA